MQDAAKSSERDTPDKNRQAEASRYSRDRRALFFLEMAISALLLLILVFTGLSRALSNILPRLPLALAAASFFVLLMLLYALITAPLSYFSGFVLPRRYGLIRQGPGGWVVDALKSLGLSLAVGSGITAAVYWLMSQTALWWLWAWLVALAASLILSVLAPVLILPLFFKTSPLPDGELRTRLLQLALKANLKIAGIYTVEFSTKTSTANAALMGLGRTRRIVLSDTILGTYSADEILVIMSHEMGHQKHGDTWRLFLFQGLILLGTFFAADIIMKWGVASLGYEGITDVAALPLFLLAVGAVGIITGPILSYFSRYLESQADLYALKLTGNPGAFISAMTRLTDQNLSEASPPRWVEILLDDHPSFRQRVDMARGYLLEG
jgi:STE24 endopeptidase